MDTPASLSSKRIGCIGCGNMGEKMLAEQIRQERRSEDGIVS